MDKRNLVVFADTKSLNEIFQTISIKMAFCTFVEDTGVLVQLHQPGKCRDFLGDIPWSRHQKKPVKIFGMTYDYANSPYDLDVLRLSLAFPTKGSMENFKKNFSLLTDKEKKYGIPESIWYETDHAKTLIIEGDKQWQSIVWKLSLYTFFIKLMSYGTLDELDHPEDEYMSALKPELEHALLSNVMTDMTFFMADIHSNHNNSGFISLIHCINAINNGSIKNTMYYIPEYYKLEPIARAVMESVECVV